MIVFPEGTRSADGILQPFKRGAFALALRSGLPIVPSAILGSGAVMPKGSFRIRSGTICVRFAEPVSVEGWTYSDRVELTSTVRGAVARLMEES